MVAAIFLRNSELPLEPPALSHVAALRSNCVHIDCTQNNLCSNQPVVISPTLTRNHIQISHALICAVIGEETLFSELMELPRTFPCMSGERSSHVFISFSDFVIPSSVTPRKLRSLRLQSERASAQHPSVLSQNFAMLLPLLLLQQALIYNSAVLCLTVDLIRQT